MAPPSTPKQPASEGICSFLKCSRNDYKYCRGTQDIIISDLRVYYPTSVHYAFRCGLPDPGALHWSDVWGIIPDWQPFCIQDFSWAPAGTFPEGIANPFELESWCIPCCENAFSRRRCFTYSAADKHQRYAAPPRDYPLSLQEKGGRRSGPIAYPYHNTADFVNYNVRTSEAAGLLTFLDFSKETVQSAFRAHAEHNAKEFFTVFANESIASDTDYDSDFEPLPLRRRLF